MKTTDLCMKKEAMQEIYMLQNFFYCWKLSSLISSGDFPNTDDAIKISFPLASVAAFHPYYGQ